MSECLIDGHHVTCGQDDLGRRVWHCDCSEYERTLLTHKEGFCRHVVIAIQRAFEIGAISLPD